MNRPAVKYVVRLALFASAVVSVACSNPTAPAEVKAKKQALKDEIQGDSLLCRNGWTVIQGRYVCN